MAQYPILYVSNVGYSASWGGDTTPDTTVNLTMPALSATCVNVAIVFTASGIDWDGTWTFFDSDGTQDTDFTSVFNNAGDCGGHNDLQVFYRTYEASKYDNKTLNVRYEPNAPATYGRMIAQWWENVRQVPSCDTIMSTGNIASHAPWSTNSAMISIGVATAYDDDFASFAAWDTDAVELHYSVAKEDGNSTANRSLEAMYWTNPADTASSDYVAIETPAGGSEEAYTFEIFPYEVVLSSPGGILALSGEIDKKLSLTRFLGGTIVFSGVQALLQLFKYIMDATVRMWLAPQSDPIEIDMNPKGFTDIGDDA